MSGRKASWGRGLHEQHGAAAQCVWHSLWWWWDCSPILSHAYRALTACLFTSSSRTSSYLLPTSSYAIPPALSPPSPYTGPPRAHLPHPPSPAACAQPPLPVNLPFHLFPASLSPTLTPRAILREGMLTGTACSCCLPYHLPSAHAAACACVCTHTRPFTTCMPHLPAPSGACTRTCRRCTFCAVCWEASCSARSIFLVSPAGGCSCLLLSQ